MGICKRTSPQDLGLWAFNPWNLWESCCEGLRDDIFFGALKRQVAPVDVIDTPEALILYVDVPGLRKDSLSVEVAQGVLTVRGERTDPNDAKDHKVLRNERWFGPFTRTFTLPKTVDPERIEATLEDGVLQVKVAKRAESAVRTIPIQ